MRTIKCIAVALLVSISFQASSAEKIYFVQSDHLGMPEVLTDENQNVVWRSGQAPFGDSAPQIEQITFNLRFPGQYYDHETGLHYNWNRYYDPETGRYLTSDPIGLDGGLNTYGYVGGNPINRGDPTGLVCGTGACVYGAFLVASGVYIGSSYLLNSIFGDGNSYNSGSDSNDRPRGEPSSNPNTPDREGRTGPLTESEQRQREYQRPKNQCDKMPPSTGDRCSDLSNEIDHFENCANWFEAWDNKWKPGRHSIKIANWRNRVQRLKEQYDRECTEKNCQ